VFIRTLPRLLAVYHDKESEMPRKQKHNPNCDGSHCFSETGEVRVYPLGTPGTLSGNLILCHACWAHENRYRYERQQDYVRGSREPTVIARANAVKAFPQHNWFSCEVYGDA
jgi:hypothetical protein